MKRHTQGGRGANLRLKNSVVSATEKDKRSRGACLRLGHTTACCKETEESKHTGWGARLYHSD